MTELPRKHRPGSVWRILVHERLGKGYGKTIDIDQDSYDFPTEFDELVIDHAIHVEQMNSRVWWLGIGPLMINVTIGERGQVKEIMVEDESLGGDEEWKHEEFKGADIWTNKK